MVKAARRFVIYPAGKPVRYEVGDEIPDEHLRLLTGPSLVEEGLMDQEEPDDQDPPADDESVSAEFVESGAAGASADDVVKWVLAVDGSDRTQRARVALAAETADGGKARKSVVTPLQELLGLVDEAPDGSEAGGG